MTVFGFSGWYKNIQDDFSFGIPIVENISIYTFRCSRNSLVIYDWLDSTKVDKQAQKVCCCDWFGEEEQTFMSNQVWTRVQVRDEFDGGMPE